MTTQDQAAQRRYHAMDQADVLVAVGGGAEGLSQDEAARRLAEHGPNRLRPPHKKSAVVRFLAQFHDVLIYVLLTAAVVTAALEHWVDTAVIAAVVVVNAIIGFIQEGKAERALEAIRGMLTTRADVIRGGERHTISAADLVPGDLVVLSSGDKVPADVRVLHARELRIDEALLTGESMPVTKAEQRVSEDAPLGDRRNMAWSGTLVTTGSGRGVVTATGDQTEIGRISELVGDTTAIATPLVRRVTTFGRQLSVAILFLAALTFAIGWYIRGLPAGEMFLAAVALAVAAIPEGLPAIMTIVLAIGVQRMARRNAIIRRLAAVDTLGAVTVICSDKTGTLTHNEMTVTTIALLGDTLAVTGEGYEPRGSFHRGDAAVTPEDEPALLELLRTGLLCSEARLVEREGRFTAEGDPMEGALLAAAAKAGLLRRDVEQDRALLDTVPFRSESQFMATLHAWSGQSVLSVKGAPERVLEMCDAAPDPWLERAEALACDGQRVLALARKALPGDVTGVSERDLQGLELLGLVGVMDPPRQDAILAIAQCHEAGIRVKMITGDHASTARAIGRRMGIGDGRTVVTGRDIDRTAPEDLPALTQKADVFARVSPEHKLRLVEAIQAGGDVTAMTGDGVNDAPALKRADVGIAMGGKGTEVTKEAAEMVLADDNFASIASAVEEGRTVYDNLRKAILFILPTNGGEAGTILLAVALGKALPLTPVQVLWVNTITAVTLALALAFEPPERGVMRRPPRNPSEGLLDGYFLWRIAFVTTILCTGTFGLFVLARGAGASEELARTVAVNTLVLFEMFYLLSCRFVLGRSFGRALLRGNRWVFAAIATVVALQVVFTYAPFMQTLFGTEALGVKDWVVSVLTASTVFVLVEIEKGVVRGMKRRRGAERGEEDARHHHRHRREELGSRP